MDGCFHILRNFRAHGAPARRTRDWTGRWWTIWNAADLVPMGNKVLVGNPHLVTPFTDATEIEILGRDKGRITTAPGYASFGEPVRRVRSKAGKVSELWLAGANFKPEKALAAEMEKRYARKKRKARS
jgi:hypothetical protein